MALNIVEKQLLNRIYNFIFNNHETVIVDNKVNVKPVYEDLGQFCKETKYNYPSIGERYAFYTPCIETYCIMHGYIKAEEQKQEGETDNGKE